MVRIGVVGSGRRKGRSRGSNIENLLGTRVYVGRIQLSVLHGSDDLSGARQAGGRHLEAAARAHSLHRTVRTTPVGDDHAGETPLGSQYVGEQVLVLVSVNAVDEVVGAHDRPRLGNATHDFEASQVNFAHRALVHDGVRRHTA